MAHYQEAVRLKPGYAEAHYNLGLALRTKGQLVEALAQYQEALRLKPDYVKAHSDRALTWLLAGDFKQGWPEYEWRLQSKYVRDFRRSCPQPQWDGSSLTGKTILLQAEVGFGDTIQLIRYASLLKNSGGSVIVECQPVLVPLLQSCVSVDRVVAQGCCLPPFDVHTSLMGLPRILGTTLSTIPAEVPYLFADANLVEHWRREVQALTLPSPPGRGLPQPSPQGEGRVRASKSASSGNARTCSLVTTNDRRLWQLFAPLAALPGVQLISLQKRTGAEQLAGDANPFSVTDLGSDFDRVSGAFMDTAAVMQHLDLVVSVDTAVAHCAGALGVPVWVALPFVPHPTWMLQRDDSPWYPTMRLFRQKHWGDWDEVFGRIAKALFSG